MTLKVLALTVVQCDECKTNYGVQTEKARLVLTAGCPICKPEVPHG